jgi:hypothetical protein
VLGLDALSEKVLGGLPGEELPKQIERSGDKTQPVKDHSLHSLA